MADSKTFSFYFKEIVAVLRAQFYLFPLLNRKFARCEGRLLISGNKSNLSLGKFCRFGDGVTIKLSNEKREKQICLAASVVIDGNVLLNSHDGYIALAKRSYIGYGCVLQGKGGVEIGPWVMLGPYVKVFSSDHNYDRSSPIPFRDQGERATKIVIGSNSWIGSDVIILRGAILGSNVVISAGCKIKGSVPSNSTIRD